jgi:hypothetical protein
MFSQYRKLCEYSKSGILTEHCPDIIIQPLDQLIEVECASGQTLPYSGFIEAAVEIPGVPNATQQYFLFLVVPQSKYSATVPILLGTNILTPVMDKCKQEHGDRFLQTAQLHTPWYLAFRCITLRDKQLKRNKNRLGIVRSAEPETILIKPNASITIKGYIDKELDYKQTFAMTETTECSVLPADIDISPLLFTYQPRNNRLIDIHVSNVTLRTVPVSPKAILCEIQPVQLEELKNSEKENEDVFSKITIDNSNLTSDQILRLQNLLKKHIDIFSKNDEDIGHYTKIKHEIHLSDNRPFKQKYRRIPPAMVDEVREHIDQLLHAGIIRKSYSQYASNVVLVRKKNGTLRMCVDYRLLNSKTLKDQYALPRIEDILDTLKGAKYFSVVDMKSGYHQLDIKEEHKERTAFQLGPLGFYEFNRLPFGLCKSPATYQRVIQECLGDLNYKICVIYLDDLIIFSNNFEEHLERLETVLNRLRECNLKLAPAKCVFMQEEVKYVGFIVSQGGIATDPDKVEKVVKWPIPTNPEEVRQFVGFVGFYRKYIKDFTKIVRPLYEVMPVQNQKSGKKTKSDENFVWGESQQKAFTQLKELLTSAPILGYADHNLPFELHTDASGDGLGAVLYQKQDDQLRVIAFASRALTKSEKNYATHKLEFLALKWAISEKFADYLYGCQFTVMTDNNPLTYVLSSA